MKRNNCKRIGNRHLIYFYMYAFTTKPNKHIKKNDTHIFRIYDFVDFIAFFMWDTWWFCICSMQFQNQMTSNFYNPKILLHYNIEHLNEKKKKHQTTNYDLLIKKKTQNTFFHSLFTPFFRFECSPHIRNAQCHTAMIFKLLNKTQIRLFSWNYIAS